MESYEIYRYQKLATNEFQWTLCRTKSSLTSLQAAVNEFNAMKESDNKTPLRIVKITTEVIVEQ